MAGTGRLKNQLEANHFVGGCSFNIYNIAYVEGYCKIFVSFRNYIL